MVENLKKKRKRKRYRVQLLGGCIRKIERVESKITLSYYISSKTIIVWRNWSQINLTRKKSIIRHERTNEHREQVKENEKKIDQESRWKMKTVTVEVAVVQTWRHQRQRDRCGLWSVLLLLLNHGRITHLLNLFLKSFFLLTLFFLKTILLIFRFFFFFSFFNSLSLVLV